MSILPKAMCTLKEIYTKIPLAFFSETEQRILIFMLNNKGPGIVKAILRKENWLEVSCSLTSNCILKLQ